MNAPKRFHAIRKSRLTNKDSSAYQMQRELVTGKRLQQQEIEDLKEDFRFHTAKLECYIKALIKRRNYSVSTLWHKNRMIEELRDEIDLLRRGKKLAEDRDHNQ